MKDDFLEKIRVDPYFRFRENTIAVMKDDFLKNIRIQLHQGVYGDDGFVRAMKEKFKIVSLRRVGRPRKK